MVNTQTDYPQTKDHSITAGIDLIIPKETWIHLGLTVGLTAAAIILMLIFKKIIDKHI